MTAKIISIVNQKGGCGKTTICMNLAATIKDRTKNKVLVVDCDIQGSATKWYSKASSTNTFPCPVMNLAQTEGSAAKAIREFKEDYDYIIVDCPPSTNAKINASVLLVSDLALVVLKPGSTDYDALPGILELIDTTKGTNEELISKILFNMCLPTTNLSKMIIKVCEDRDDLSFMSTKINTRATYSEVAVYGGYAYNSSNSQAKNEMALLADEVVSIVMGDEK